MAKRKPSILDLKHVIVILTTVLIIIVVLFTASQIQIPVTTTTTTAPTTTTVPPTTTTTTLPIEVKGTLIVAVKDVTHNIAGGTVVHGLNMNISSISVHYVANNETNETGEWIMISNETKQLDLLGYTTVKAIIGEKDIEPGKYTQIRLYIPDATITVTNRFFYIYSNRTYSMYIPSEEIKLVHQFNVEAGKTTVLTLDFDVENSVSPGAIMGKRYIFKPVIKILEESLTKGQRPENSEII